jgi:hypothetical protein
MFLDYTIRDAVPEDIDLLAQTMREADRRELWALDRITPGDALRMSLEAAVRAYTVKTGAGEVICMFGVGPLGGMLGFTGCPWMLGSDLLERPEISREFIRRSREWARTLEMGFTLLVNRVHAENRLAVRWLKWLGFTFADRPERINGEDFYLFWRNC